MILAKYKKQFWNGLFDWLWWVAATEIPWAIQYWPLDQAKWWAVMEWLVSSAIGIAFFRFAIAQAARGLTNRSRIKDALALIGFFGRWLVPTAIFCGLVALRFCLVVWDEHSDVASLVNALTPQGKSFRGAIVVIVLFAGTGIMVFAFRMVAVLVRKYDREAE